MFNEILHRIVRSPVTRNEMTHGRHDPVLKLYLIEPHNRLGMGDKQKPACQLKAYACYHQPIQASLPMSSELLDRWRVWP